MDREVLAKLVKQNEIIVSLLNKLAFKPEDVAPSQNSGRNKILGNTSRDAMLVIVFTHCLKSH